MFKMLSSAGIRQQWNKLSKLQVVCKANPVLSKRFLSSEKKYKHAQAIEYKTLVEMQKTTSEIFADRHLFGTRMNESKSSDPWQWMTYQEFAHKVDSCMAGLASIGVEPGDKVACISNNRWEWAVSAYATYKLGGAFVPMYEAQKPKEWAYILNDSEAKVVLTSKKDIYRQAHHFAGVVGNVQEVLCFESRLEKPHSFERLLEAGAAKNFADFEQGVGPEDLATVIYTSGTTGNPKGVELVHRNIVHNIRGMWPISPEGGNIVFDDTSLSFLPWAHCYGQTAELHTMMAHGARMALAGGIDTLLRDLGEVRPTLLFSVPTLFKKVYDGVQANFAEQTGAKKLLIDRALAVANERRLLLTEGQQPGALLSLQHKVLDKLVLSKVREKMGGRIKISWVGGAATGLDVLRFFDNVGVPICEGYGLTETSPVISNRVCEANLIGSVGKPPPGTTLRITDPETGKELPAGKAGVVMAKGPQIMSEYMNNPEATQKAIDKDGFFDTGDLGMINPATGDLIITGRAKDTIVLSNGENIAPQPIEDFLTGECKAVDQITLVGQDARFLGALVVVNPDELAARGLITKEDAQRMMKVLGPTPQSTGVQGSAEEVARETALLNSKPEIKDAVLKEIKKASKGAKFIKSWEVVSDAILLFEPFSIANGYLTQTLKVKRNVVADAFKKQIDALYGY
mmetsp:Transcript_36422/g.63158  ORF Transcript_36422/g.63158 Transcript_36422/m.63158 type:complete len:684 (-) Transcript_36422:303-2354(-)